MAKDWIQKAIKHKGVFKAKAKAHGETTLQYAQQEKHAKGKTGDQARLALSLIEGKV